MSPGIVLRVSRLLVAAALGAAVTTAAGAAAAPTGREPVGSRQTPTATLTLSGAAGRYLQFSGRRTLGATFRGSLAFRRPVGDGTYTLAVTFRDAAGLRTRLLYDVDIRGRH